MKSLHKLRAGLLVTLLALAGLTAPVSPGARVRSLGAGVTVGNVHAPVLLHLRQVGAVTERQAGRHVRGQQPAADQHGVPDLDEHQQRRVVVADVLRRGHVTAPVGQLDQPAPLGTATTDRLHARRHPVAGRDLLAARPVGDGDPDLQEQQRGRELELGQRGGARRRPVGQREPHADLGAVPARRQQPADRVLLRRTGQGEP